ncbi:MAG: DNRLRE domain-containing protein, partial [Acidimicrobiales bacterium]
MAVRRIYLFVLVALLAAVLPLASIDLADAQDRGERLSFSGGAEPDRLVRSDSAGPTVPAVSPGWPNADEIGDELPTHRFSSDDAAGAPEGEGRERARLVTPNDSGIADGEELSLRVPFGGERGPVELVGDGAGGVRSAPGSAFDVEIPGTAGGAASRTDRTPPATLAPEAPSESVEDPAGVQGVDGGEPASGGEDDPADDTSPVDDVPAPGPTTEPDGVAPGAVDGLSRSVAAVTVDGERLVLGVDGGVSAPGRSAGGGSGVRFGDVAASGADVTVAASDVGVKTTWELASIAEFDAGLVETLEIPAGWAATQVGSAVEIRDETGELVVLWAGGPVWDAQIAADYGFASDGDLNPYTLAAVAALEGVTDEAEVERILAEEVPSSQVVGYASVELVGVVDGVVTVRHVVDPAWIADPVRVWPVSVDPTLAPNPSNGYTTNEYFPNSSYYWATNDGFTVGQGIGQYEKTGYVEFDLSTIEDSGALIDSATLELYQDYADTCSSRLLEVSRLTEAFDSSVSYNNPSSITTNGQASQNSNKGRFFCSDGWIYVDVTDIVQAWADGVTNYGFRLDGDYTSTSSTKIFEDSPAPVLDITYTALSVDATYSPLSTPVGNYPEAGSDVSSPVLGDPQGGVLPVAVTNDGNRDWFDLGICLGYRLYD